MMPVLAAALLSSVLAAEPAPPALEVELQIPKKLALAYGPGEKAPHLAGTVVATLRNRTDKPVRLRDLAEHGMVFVSEKGALHVLVHSCKCVKDAAEPAGSVFELAPGQERKVTVDDWGCGGGSWAAPPAGKYTLEYRVLPAPEKLPEPSTEGPGALVPRCRADFASEKFWEGSTRSAGVKVELRNPGGKPR